MRLAPKAVAALPGFPCKQQKGKLPAKFSKQGLMTFYGKPPAPVPVFPGSNIPFWGIVVIPSQCKQPWKQKKSGARFKFRETASSSD